ncbi:MAG: response regulator [Desulfosoma sp.]
MKRRPNILIVDDEENQREFLRRWLGNQGYEADDANCAEEALERLDRQIFDIVFWDMTMPGMDGLAVLQQVKERCPEALVVVMADRTHGAFGEAAAEAVKAGAADFLIKPPAPDLLEPLMARLMRMKALMMENALLREEIHRVMGFENPPEDSPAMQRHIGMVQDGFWVPVELSLAEVERRHIENVLAHWEGNVSRAARVLGLHRSTLHKKVHQYGITWKRGRGRPRNTAREIPSVGF